MRKISLSALFTGLFLLNCAAVFAAVDQATILDIAGEAKFMKKGDADWKMLEKGMVLSEGDRLKTAPNSQVILNFAGSAKTAEVVVRPESEFAFDTFRHEDKTDKTLLDVQIGSVLVKAEKLIGDSKFEVKTPTSIVGIRGTTFEVQVAKS